MSAGVVAICGAVLVVWAAAGAAPSTSALMAEVLHAARGPDPATILRKTQGEEAEQRPSQSGDPPGDHISRIVHAQQNPRRSHEKRDQKRDTEDVTLDARVLGELGEDGADRRIKHGRDHGVAAGKTEAVDGDEMDDD